MRLFLSYSRDDKDWVYALWDELRDEAFHDVWLDRRIVPATDWWETILHNIETCECLVFVMTPSSVNSIYCLAELEYAAALNKPILPLMLESCDFPDILSQNRVQYQLITDDMSMDRTLLKIEQGLGEVRVALVQNRFRPRKAPRPDLPQPRQARPEHVFETFALAEEALSEGNESLAKELFEHVIKADPDGLGMAATERLDAINFENDRTRDYQNVVRLASNSATMDGAAAVWRVFQQKYGTDYDPEGIGAQLATQPQHQPSQNSTPAAPQPASPGLLYGAATDSGMVRGDNQDAILAQVYHAPDGQIHAGLFIVADGMGGHQDGDKASKLAIATVEDVISRNRHQLNSTSAGQLLVDAIQQANDQVSNTIAEAGTTVTACLAIDQNVFVAHVGDSRMYRIDAPQITQITRDHSLVQRLIELGQLTPEEAETYPQRNVLYRALGQSESLEVDLMQSVTDPKATYLICSDGLWNIVEENHLREIIASATDLQATCSQLIDMANQRGGPDNISVILFRYS